MPEHHEPPWYPIVGQDLADGAAAVARDIAVRLRNDEVVSEAARRTVRQSAFPQVRQPAAYSMSGGNAGLALLFADLDACSPSEGWDVIGHRHLLAAVRAVEEQRHLALGVFAGLSGVAFAAWSLSRQGTRYRKLLAGIEQRLFPQAINLAISLTGQTNGYADAQYDLISGVAGIGAYLLCRQADPEATTALQSVLKCLIALAQEDEHVPRWRVPVDLIAYEPWREVYPDGYLNCGLAHGIPGPLTVLALARSFDIETPGIDEAIRRLADWLIAHRLDDEWGINWPSVFPLGRVNETSYPFQASRTAWCYGSPGIARALWLAGVVLDSSVYREIAVDAMKAVYRRPLAVRNIASPTFCHGVAGLLHITLRFAYDTGDAFFKDAANDLVRQLLSLYQPDSLLGFRHLETEQTITDDPWLLEGVAGVVLVLLATCTTRKPEWDRLFLLS